MFEEDSYLKLLEVTWSGFPLYWGGVSFLTPRLEEYPSSGSLMHARIAD